MRPTCIPSRSLLMFAGRTALAASLGLFCSILLGLHEPHWAAWTVVSVGTATRGDGLLKSLNRAAGTAVGAPIAIVLVFASHGSEPWLIGLLSVWLALCVYVGVSLRNYRAYAAVLAGYSTTIIAMSLSGESGQLIEIGRDRCIGVVIGIVSALVVVLLSRDVQTGYASRRIRQAIAAACAWGSDRLAGMPRRPAGDGSGPERLRKQLGEILSLDGAVSSAAGESPRLWRHAGRLSGVVSALLEMLVMSRGVERDFVEAAATRNVISAEIDVAVAGASRLLNSIARALNGNAPDELATLQNLHAQARSLGSALIPIGARNVFERRRIDLVSGLLGATAEALQTYLILTGESVRTHGKTESYPPPVYSYDRSYAVAAALRAGAALLLAGAISIATDWQGGPLFVSFTAIAVALFAIRPDPRKTGIHFFASGAVGACAALFFCVAVTPHLPHATDLALAEGWMVFLALVISSLLSNTFWGSGFCLVFLVVADPQAIAHATITAESERALGVLAGSALAALAFHLVPSRELEHRSRKQLLRRIVGAIRASIFAPLERRTLHTHHAWQSRGLDTLVRIALPATTAGDVDESVLWIEVGAEMLKLRHILRADAKSLAPSARKTVDQLLDDLSDLEFEAWHVRLIAADVELRDSVLVADQSVLRVRAAMLEVASLLKRIAALKHPVSDIEEPGPRSERIMRGSSPAPRR